MRLIAPAIVAAVLLAGSAQAGASRSEGCGRVQAPGPGGKIYTIRV